MDRICEQAHGAVQAYLDDVNVPVRVKDRIKESQGIIMRALSVFRDEELAMSFNGGKDCLVMLILILDQLFTSKRIPQKLKSVYVRAEDSFPQVDKFVDECVERYKLDLVTSDRPMKEALASYLQDYRGVRAIFVGIRRADPWAATLRHIQKTDHGWPDFLRLQPVLDWEYSDVWTFLRHAKVPYCQLYDEGYTSLGGMSSTKRNPRLEQSDGTYAPAYELTDASAERVGRSSRESPDIN